MPNIEVGWSQESIVEVVMKARIRGKLSVEPPVKIFRP